MSHPFPRKSRVYTEISVKADVADSLTFVALGAVLILAIACVFTWRGAVRARRQVRRLQDQIERFERERAGRPSLRVAFEFNATTREALVHVTNDGAEARAWARMSVEGPLAQRVGADLRAAWLDQTADAVTIPRGQLRTLRLAELDLSVFPYAQWQIYGVGDRGAFSVRALNTSMIGGDPETHAPTLFLQVAVTSSPESIAPTPECTIALQPFEAVRLRPV